MAGEDALAAPAAGCRAGPCPRPSRRDACAQRERDDGRTGMTRLRKSLAVAAMALVMGSLAAGCGGSGPVSGAVGSAISSLSPSRTASISLPTNGPPAPTAQAPPTRDRKSTRLNSSHRTISYAVFCLKKKKTKCTHLIYKKNKKKVNI